MIMMNNKYYIKSFTLKDELELGFVEIKHFLRGSLKSINREKEQLKCAKEKVKICFFPYMYRSTISSLSENYK